MATHCSFIPHNALVIPQFSGDRKASEASGDSEDAMLIFQVLEEVFKCSVSVLFRIFRRFASQTESGHKITSPLKVRSIREKPERLRKNFVRLLINLAPKIIAEISEKVSIFICGHSQSNL